MKITYDEQEDVLRILLTEAPIETVNEISADQTLDYDRHGTLVGLEMRNALNYMLSPERVEVSGLIATATATDRPGANMLREKQMQLP